VLKISSESVFFSPDVELFRWIRFRCAGGTSTATINILSGSRANK